MTILNLVDCFELITASGKIVTIIDSIVVYTVIEFIAAVVKYIIICVGSVVKPGAKLSFVVGFSIFVNFILFFVLFVYIVLSIVNLLDWLFEL